MPSSAFLSLTRGPFFRNFRSRKAETGSNDFAFGACSIVSELPLINLARQKFSRWRDNETIALECDDPEAVVNGNARGRAPAKIAAAHCLKNECRSGAIGAHLPRASLRII